MTKKINGRYYLYLQVTYREGGKVKTKNKYYGMRSTLDRLGFDVIKFERAPADNGESKLYLSKRISRDLVETHRTRRAVVTA